MRILFVTQVVLDRPFGGPRHVTAVAREWARAGHAVTLLAPGGDLPADGVHRVRPWPWLRPGVGLEAAQAALVLREVARVRPDVAYVRISPSTLFGPTALAAVHVPVVLELNGRVLDELSTLGRSRAAVAVVAANLRRIVRRARAVVAVEAKIARHAREALGADRVVVVENGADLDIAHPGDRERARRVLGLNLETPVVAFCGTFVPELRLDVLFDAMALLPGVELVMAGGGPQADRVRRAAAASDRIRWFGVVSHPRAISILHAADVCVNVRDGDLGMKALEYAAVGRRFVAFDVERSSRLDTLYPDHRAAFWVSARTPAALAAGLRAALAEEAAGPLPAMAVEQARRQVGWDRTAARIARVLEDARAPSDCGPRRRPLRPGPRRSGA